MTLLPGASYPLGALVTPDGVNFAVYSAEAKQLWLCLFDQHQRPLPPLAMYQGEGHIWYGLVKDADIGTLYGFRAEGPWQPQRGLRFDINKLLIDPYAKAITHQPDLAALVALEGDNGHLMPKSVVVADNSNAPRNHPDRPNIPISETVLYELHPKGFSQLNPYIAQAKRGTVEALADPWAIAHFKRLGVTAIELMPVTQFASEAVLADKGLSNFWGYNPVGFFLIHQSYCPGGPVQFRHVVDQLHRHGIEVIVDIVFNHSAESDQHGPTLSFRGLDNRSYYRLSNDGSHYLNDSGCGNSLNLAHPMMIRLVCDSLRYWSDELGVDGFRFDLATALGREPSGFSAAAGLFDAIGQDPLLSQLKLIAEPWDLGSDGYQLGQFPYPWREWNDHYRDTVRRFWRGDNGQLPELAKCLFGSAERFQHNGRGPATSVNFITSHDGFTLNDLVSYQQRHNHDNGERNQDGHGDNCSFNCGIEGPSQDAAVNQQRLLISRSLLATLLLSQGTPMLLAGDELGHSQQGNNNAYCQNNAISWLFWPELHRHSAWIASLTALRRRFPHFQPQRFNHHQPKGPGTHFYWLRPNGQPMAEQHWQQRELKALQVLLSCHESDDQLLLLLNGDRHDVAIALPDGYWQVLIDSSDLESDAATAAADTTNNSGGTAAPLRHRLLLQAHGLLLLHRVINKDLHDESIQIEAY